MDGLNHPWGFAFLPNHSILITERRGKLKLLNQRGKIEVVLNTPKVWANGQGGLLDVAIDKHFNSNNIIFLSYSKSSLDGRKAGTAVTSAVLDRSGQVRLRNKKVIFSQRLQTRSTVHFGSRIVVSPSGQLFITIGDRGNGRRAQDPFDYSGSIIRLLPDGSSPRNNPFFISKMGLPKIWSIGHRNPQGAAWNSYTNSIWTVEHGAMGGDELNQPQSGKNYGWPVISYGRHYSGAKIGVGKNKVGMEQPIYYWDPSIAPSGLAFYSGKLFPKWRGHAFAGALKYQLLVRLKLVGNDVVEEERMFQGIFGRIRDVRQGPEGCIYFLTDENPGGLFKIRPARSPS
ncbi:MAG: PQQ-dependent sugar dehydrogenase [Pseudomonadota bacterium]|nr:PQQ-dependent sugar dehydrogenase [Pseudomonadota bacterium]